MSARLLALLTALALSASVHAGTSGGHPVPVGKLTSLTADGKLSLTGKVSGVRWVGPGLPGPVTRPSPRLVAPVGAWTDVVLTFDGPVTLRGVTDAGEALTATVTLSELVVPLEVPASGGEALSVELALPAWLTSGPGGEILPGDADYEALVAAIRDGALAR